MCRIFFVRKEAYLGYGVTYLKAIKKLVYVGFFPFHGLFMWYFKLLDEIKNTVEITLWWVDLADIYPSQCYSYGNLRAISTMDYFQLLGDIALTNL